MYVIWETITTQSEVSSSCQKHHVSMSCYSRQVSTTCLPIRKLVGQKKHGNGRTISLLSIHKIIEASSKILFTSIWGINNAQPFPGTDKDAYTIFFRIPGAESPLGGSTHRRDDNKSYLKVTGCDCVEWIRLTQNKDQVAVSFEHDNKPSCYIKGGEFLNHLSDHQYESFLLETIIRDHSNTWHYA
jgi:hypothetical protein